MRTLPDSEMMTLAAPSGLRISRTAPSQAGKRGRRSVREPHASGLSLRLAAASDSVPPQANDTVSNRGANHLRESTLLEIVCNDKARWTSRRARIRSKSIRIWPQAQLPPSFREKKASLPTIALRSGVSQLVCSSVAETLPRGTRHHVGATRTAARPQAFLPACATLKARQK